MRLSNEAKFTAEREITIEINSCDEKIEFRESLLIE